ncbi:hypothetical protein EHO58_13160 [Leptospira selangorensis]|uniref:hypothetical protein n=1 Tax=Leptospira selangorensis TaxID=2484982 RepID=UPI0010844C6F|nr:hypothetical protein [Leptospira selangorensis]TGK03369.1 hypothetical protein EHO58_13160 [Leptospira selangorensis]
MMPREILIFLLLLIFNCTPNIRDFTPKRSEISPSDLSSLKTPFGVGFFRLSTRPAGGLGPVHFYLEVKDGSLPNFSNPSELIFRPFRDPKEASAKLDECVILIGNTAELRIINYRVMPTEEEKARDRRLLYSEPSMFTKRALQLRDGEIHYFGTVSFGRLGNIETKSIDADKLYCMEKLKGILPDLDLKKTKDRIMVKYHE